MIESVKLNNGVEMPLVGYGVYQIPLEDTARCVRDALDVGYRLIDTAQCYSNEEGVGEGIATSGVRREDVFLVSKVWLSRYGYEKAKASIDESLRKLRTDYLDLMLLHQPFCDYYGAYRALEEAYRAGKVRAIGVSNFQSNHFIDLASNVEVVPVVNQVETHIFHQRWKDDEYMKEFGTQIMSWGPLAEGRNGFFTNPVLTRIAQAHGRSVAQVELRFLYQRGIVIIPKSTHRERMVENLAIDDFALTDEEMAQIKSEDRQTSVFFNHNDPETVKNFMEWRSIV